MSGDFYLLGVSASSGLPSSLLSKPEVAVSPILCLTAKLSAFAGLHNIPLHSQKRSWSWYQRLLMHVGGGRRPICLPRRAPIVSRALPSAGMPPRRSRPGNCRIRKARGGWWGMVAASPVRPLAFSRAPKTVQGRRTPLTLLHSGVKPAWIPLPGLCTHSLTTTSPKIWSTASGCWNKEYHRLLKEGKTYWTLLKILICAENYC